MNPEVINEVKALTRLTDYVGVSEGTYVVCPTLDCPSRQKGEKKCKVSSDSWRCFRCEAFGDVIDWRSHRDRIPLARALAAFSDELGLTVLSCPERSRLLNAYVDAAHAHLMATLDNHAYLTKTRGIPLEILQRYRIGYADPEGRVLKASGLSNGELLATGLVRIIGDSAAPAGLSPYFGGHYVLPYTTTTGETLQIKGRLDAARSRDPKAPKSLGLPSKSDHAPAEWRPVGCHQLLFGEQFLPLAKKSVLLNEGEFDVLTAASWDLVALGISGGKLSVRARKLLMDCGLSVYDARDQDKASEPKFVDDSLATLMQDPTRKYFRVRWPALAGFEVTGEAVKVDVNDLAVVHGWGRDEFMGVVKAAEPAHEVVVKALAKDFRRADRFDKLAKLYRRWPREQRPQLLDLVHEHTGVPKPLMAFGLDPAAWKPERRHQGKVSLFPENG